MKHVIRLFVFAFLALTAPAAPPSPGAVDVGAIYSAKSEAEAKVAARKYVIGLWSSTGYKTSNAGLMWQKWEFFPDGTAIRQSATSTERKWRSSEKKKWGITTSRLKSTGESVYLVQFEEEPSDLLFPPPPISVIIHRDGTLEWNSVEVGCYFQRGDLFKDR